MKITKFLTTVGLVSSIAVLSSLIFSQNVQAGCHWADFTCKDSAIRRGARELDPTSDDSWINNPTFRSFNVHVENNTNEPIIVTVRWYGRFSGISGDGRGGSTNFEERWETASWDLAPHKKTFIINNARGRNIYFSARSANGRSSWGEKAVDMGSQYSNFFYKFNQ